MRHMNVAGITRVVLGMAAAGMLATRSQAAVTQTIEDVAGRVLPQAQQHGTARALAMDSAWVAVADGASAVQWNPGGLGRLAAAEVGLHHATLLGDAVGETVTAGVPLGAKGGIGIAVELTDQGSFERRDANGVLRGSYGAGTLGVSAGWGHRCATGLTAGAAVKGLNQTLAGARASFYAVDLGALYDLAAVPGLTIGATYANLGLTRASWSLASGARVGAAYSLDLGLHRVLGAVAAELPREGVTRVNIGAEDVILSILALRAGYLLNLKDQGVGGLSGVTAGLGVTYRGLALDYAFVPSGDLGTGHRVSLTYRFLPAPATGGAQ